MQVKSTEGFEAGQKLDWASMFSEGDLVDVQGTSVGKGFQGGIKRHNFKRGLMSHGSKSHREHGKFPLVCISLVPTAGYVCFYLSLFSL